MSAVRFKVLTAVLKKIQVFLGYEDITPCQMKTHTTVNMPSYPRRVATLKVKRYENDPPVLVLIRIDIILCSGWERLHIAMQWVIHMIGSRGKPLWRLFYRIILMVFHIYNVLEPFDSVFHWMFDIRIKAQHFWDRFAPHPQDNE
jgi:hypothetical protein